jgi:two-component system, response regulator, stage 0 sporulation protein F
MSTPLDEFEAFTSHGSLITSGPARVLLAEDDSELRGLLALTLRADGLQVSEVEDGAQMIDALTPGPDGSSGFDLVISDILMPRHDGLDAVARLRWTDQKVPVIFITAFGEDRTHQLAARLGAVAVFDKPFDLDDLRTAVVHALHARWRAA